MFSFFKKRDATAFPADEYGDELYRVMQKDPEGEKSVGVDLAFSFATEADARSFLSYIDHAEYTPEIEPPDQDGGSWTVETMREVQPRYAPVRALIEQMRSSAAARTGTLSGWHLFW